MILKILSLNTFLVPSIFNHKTKNTHQYKRAVAINAMIRNYDFCFFQEVWGPGLPDLLHQLDKEYQASHSYNSYVYSIARLIPFSKTINTVFNSITCFLNAYGGLLSICKVEHEVLWTNHTQFNVSATSSRKGIQSNFYRVNNSYLLVLNSHLDAVNDENKLIQISQLRQTLERDIPRCLNTCKDNALVVMLVGDYNIKADSELYHRMKKILSPEDALLDTCTSPEATYSAQNSYVEYPQINSRIDYVLLLGGIRLNEQSYSFQRPKTTYKVLKQDYRDEVSDHYPIQIEMEL